MNINISKKRLVVIIVIVVLVVLVISVLNSGRRTSLSSPRFAARDLEQDLNLGKDQGGVTAPMMERSQPQSQEVVSGTAEFEDVVQEDRLIVRTATLSVVSEDVQSSVDELTRYATSVGGFVVQSDVSELEGAPSATVVLRVPVEHFDEAREKAREVGLRVVSESTVGEDVTEEYVDSQARLRNLQASEAQFLEIMKQAVAVEDVLKVQQQLERVRGQIERTQVRLQYLERSAKLATITVYLSTDEGDLPIVDPVERWRPLVVIRSAFRSFLKTLQSLGTLVIWIVIFVPIWLPVLLILYWIGRRKRKQTIPPVQ